MAHWVSVSTGMVWQLPRAGKWQVLNMGLAGYRRRAGKGARDEPWEKPNPSTENGYQG
jgi:hypothetical protein